MATYTADNLCRSRDSPAKFDCVGVGCHSVRRAAVEVPCVQCLALLAVKAHAFKVVDPVISTDRPEQYWQVVGRA